MGSLRATDESEGASDGCICRRGKKEKDRVWRGSGRVRGMEKREKNEKAKSLLLSFNDGPCCDFVSPVGAREKLGAETFSVPSAAER